MKAIGGIKLIMLAAALACLGVFVSLGAALAFGPETVVPGVTVLDADLSGLTREEADVRLLLLEKELVRSVPLVLRYGASAWQIRPVNIGLSVDRERILDEAMQVGRRGTLVQRWAQGRRAAREGVHIPVYVKIDQSRLDQELGAIAHRIIIPPRDARLKINPDETVVVEPSRDGVKVDVEKACRDIIRVFEDYDQAPEISLALIKDVPRKTTREVADMGVNGLLASYSTTFDHCDAGRSYNIKMAAAALDGLFVPPGEAFSFNNVVGPRSSETGYKNSKVIINNELVEGPGGGVCQVSSTLYNAVLLANLEILDRTNHSIPVPYVPPGRDATVVYDLIDFRFKNTSPGYVYLKTLAGSGRVTVKIYGSTDCRREVSIRTRVMETIPFKEIYQQDSSLGHGELKVMRKGIPGLRVLSERVLLDNDACRVENLPPSFYHSVDQIIVTGPGFKVPESAGRPSGEEPAAGAL